MRQSDLQGFNVMDARGLSGHHVGVQKYWRLSQLLRATLANKVARFHHLSNIYVIPIRGLYCVNGYSILP